MSDLQMIILTQRRRGRPIAKEPGTIISAWVPTRVYDSLNRIANKKDISVSALVGQVLTRRLPRKP